MRSRAQCERDAARSHGLLNMTSKTLSRPRRLNPTRRQTEGFVLLEALVALLIFSIGVLGLIGLQATSIKQASAAEYRSIATLQANDLISRMWVSDKSTAPLTAMFASSVAGTGYTNWKSDWADALPGAKDNLPTVTVTSVSGGGATPVSSSQVTVIVYWQAPSDTTAHNYTVVAQLK